MLGWLGSFFRLFLTCWGAFIISFLDSTILFVIPFGNDAVIVYLAARHPELFWLYPLIMTAGSFFGTALTFWIGRKAGDEGLPRLIPQRRLERIREQVRNAGAGSVAIAAVVPPPFPLTPFVLTSGAFAVDPLRFFSVFVVMRLVRFGVEATLARTYGSGILQVLHSTVFEIVIGVLIVAAVGGTIASAIVLWRRTRRDATR